jgi:hypothetical protein
MRLPPIEERDGSAAWSVAPDQAEWVDRHSAGEHHHRYRCPPEVAYLIPEGAQWERIESILRPALRARGIGPGQQRLRPPKRTVNPRTRAACAALAAYCYDEFAGENLDGRELARRAADYATRQGLAGADSLDPGASAMRELAGAVLQAIETVNRNKSSYRP